ncbi:NitT/TauT family transport system substrate-binding protein [Hoeflea marina]|uniref:NitT/TauT family transport system substrate-binding protein n=1 Tax=Hoeflea marina TaxID=274592 RepID=A0A317PMB0_9HYPH|nr:ABC transporter substrate-binding protein [Hoeflea marina]PWW01409.1 NitT/TauT family transport system substrate-binding protein [Hoeflea marina]
MFKMTRRTTLRRMTSAMLAASLGLGFTAAAHANDTIKIGILSLTSHSPSIIAAGKGYFGEQGLDVEFVSFQAAQPMAVAIASNDIDFGMTAISGGLISLAEKGAIKIIGGALQETPEIDGQKILAAKAAYDAGLTSPDKLVGHSFGVTTQGSSFHYMAHKIADKAGFDRSEIRIVPMQKVPAVIAALKSGQIDAWSIVPNIAGALTKGPEVVEIGKVSDYIDNYQVTTVFTSTKNVTDHKDLVKRFLAGLAKGIDDYNAAYVDKTLGADDVAAISEMVHKYVYADQPMDKAAPRIAAGAMRINRNAKLNLASVEDQLKWFQSEKLVPGGVTMDDLVDTEFVETF